MKHLKPLFFILSVLVTSFLGGQKQIPVEQLQAPLDINLLLSGCFGELRSAHFHAGLDFKTQQREGLPVYAIADGEVVRINVSATGYGQSVYILHPEKYMSVYAHLQHFAPNLNSAIRREQYRKQCFETDYHLPVPIKVKKGDIIGYSGNTGSSGGPHLHFELRNAQGNVAYNPALYGFMLKDSIPPSLLHVAVYPADEQSTVNGVYRPAFFPVQCKDGTCVALMKDTVRVCGNAYFGIEAIDKMNDTENIFGLYRLSLSMDGNQLYEHEINQFSFAESPQISGFIDYKRYIETKQEYQITRILPGNQLKIYKNIKNKGVYPIPEGKHTIVYAASDVAGNTSTLSLAVNGESFEIKPISAPIHQKAIFYYNKPNRYVTKTVDVSLRPNTLFENIRFEYNEESKSPESNLFSAVHHIHLNTTPLLKSYQLGIKVVDFPKALYDKAVMVEMDTTGRIRNATPCHFKDGFMYANLRKFGIFAVSIDTVSSEITPIKESNDTSGNTKKLQFRITDDLSGIDTYRATFDNRWILMEYDAKNNILTGTLEIPMTSSRHVFKLEVTDKVGNKSIYTTEN